MTHLNYNILFKALINILGFTCFVPIKWRVYKYNVNTLLIIMRARTFRSQLLLLLVNVHTY